MEYSCRSRNRLTLLLTASVVMASSACSDPASRATATMRFSVERSQSGDTVVVRNTGTNSSAVNVVLEADFTIGADTAADQKMFSVIYRGFATADGGIITTEWEPSRLQRFDSLGRFVRTYGRPGSGPGEFLLPSLVAVDARGRVIHASNPPPTVSVFDSLGKLLRTGHYPKPGGGEFYADDDGMLFVRTNLPRADSARGGRMRDYAVTVTMDSTMRIIDTVDGPDGGFQTFEIPLAPHFFSVFGTPGAWVYGHSGQYVLHRRQLDGTLLRMESDLQAAAVSDAERESLATDANEQPLSHEAANRIESKQIPAHRPFFRMLHLGADGRIWVWLHRETVEEKIERCRGASGQFGSAGSPSAADNCPDGTKPQPRSIWREPIAYDVFAPSGEMLGRVALKDGARFLSARGNHLWVAEVREGDVPVIVRYRIQFPDLIR